MQYSIKTFGCKVNTYDSGLIQKRLKEKNWTENSFSEDHEVHIVNTCAVTEEAVREARRWISRHKKKYPKVQIVVTGCAAEIEPETFASMKNVDAVVANSKKSELAEILDKKSYRSQRVFQSSIFKQTSLEKEGTLESHHTRFFLKIQDGCNSFCTFCVIPFARGKSRSIPPDDLVSSVERSYDGGVREVVLTGIHIGDYRIADMEAKKSLPKLLRILLKKTRMPRIRLSSLEPLELTGELLDLFSCDRICPHFHISIQSAETKVLKDMKRKYEAGDVANTLLRIEKKIPSAYVGMDVIAGFPSETQEQFEQGYSLLKDCPWTKMHVFPYSPRKFTYASRLKSWPLFVIKKRAALLRHLSEDRQKEKLRKQIGTIKKVLPLRNSHSLSRMDWHTGLSRDYWSVRWKDQKTFSDIQSEEKKCSEELSMKILFVNEEKHYLEGECTR